MNPLPLTSGPEGESVTGRPRRFDPTRHKEPSLSSSEWGLRKAATPLDDEVPSLEHRFRILDK